MAGQQFGKPPGDGLETKTYPKSHLKVVLWMWLLQHACRPKVCQYYERKSVYVRRKCNREKRLRRKKRTENSRVKYTF